jgi:hypothetical protein
MYPLSPFLKKVEKVNHYLIFPAILILLGVIIFDIFFAESSATVRLIAEVLDYLVLVVFVIDLIFLALHARDTKFFFRNYWLDLLAVFPFSIFFGFVGGIYRLLAIPEESLTLSQAIFHESLEVERVASEGEKVAKSGKYLKVGARVARVASKSHFFTRFERQKKEQIRE